MTIIEYNITKDVLRTREPTSKEKAAIKQQAIDTERDDLASATAAQAAARSNFIAALTDPEFRQQIKDILSDE